jgi:DNA-binding transcriptional ArsR family regulator
VPELASTISALSDPARLAIRQRLRRGETAAGELGKQPLPISAPAVSRHLKVLERAGLISRRVEAQHRVLRLDRKALADAGVGSLMARPWPRASPL